MVDNILKNQNHLCVRMNNDQDFGKIKGKRPCIQQQGSARMGRERGSREEHANVAHPLLRAPMDTACHSFQASMAKSLEWSCAIRIRHVCIDLEFDPCLLEFSGNLPITAKRLGSGLQKLSVYISTYEHESTCPKEHFTLSCLLLSVSHTEIPFDGCSSYRSAAAVISFSVAILSVDVSGV